MFETEPYFLDWNNSSVLYPPDRTPVVFYVELKNAMGGYEAQVVRGACYLHSPGVEQPAAANESGEAEP
jgi:hypothetical protein